MKRTALLFCLCLSAAVADPNVQIFFDTPVFPSGDGSANVALQLRNFGDGAGTPATLRVYRNLTSPASDADELLLEQAIEVPESFLGLSLPLPPGSGPGINFFLACADLQGFDERCFDGFTTLPRVTDRDQSDRRVRFLGEFARRETNAYIAVAVIGEHAFVKLTTSQAGAGDNVLVYDIADLDTAIGTEGFAEREAVGGVRTLEAGGGSNRDQGGLLARDGFLYSFGRAGIERIDVSDPVNPVSAGLEGFTKAKQYSVFGDQVAFSGTEGFAVYRFEADGSLTLTHDAPGQESFSVALGDGAAFVSEIGDERRMASYRLLPGGVVQPADFVVTGAIPSFFLVLDPSGRRLFGGLDLATLVVDVAADLTLTVGTAFGSGAYGMRTHAISADGTVFVGRYALRPGAGEEPVLSYAVPARPSFGLPGFGAISGRRLFQIVADRVLVFSLEADTPASLLIPRMEGALRVDGVIGDGEWPEALMTNIGTGDPTFLFLGHDGATLRMAAESAAIPFRGVDTPLALFFDDQGGMPPDLADGAWSTPCGDSDEGIYRFIGPEGPVAFGAYGEGDQLCEPGFVAAPADGAAAAIGEDAVAMVEAVLSLDAGRLQAAPGERFGANLTTGGELAPGNLAAPAAADDPAALPTLRFDTLRAIDMVRPESVTLVAGTEFFPVDQVVDGSGLNAGLFGRHGSEIDGALVNWATEDSTPDYFAAEDSPQLLFDLGSDQTIEAILVWPYSFGSGSDELFQANSLLDFNLRFATDAEGPEGFSNETDYFWANPPPPEEAARTFRELHRLDRRRTARYVLMTITDNHFGKPGSNGGDRVGLGEVAFVVPAERVFADSIEDRVIVP